MGPGLSRGGEGVGDHRGGRYPAPDHHRGARARSPDVRADVGRCLALPAAGAVIHGLHDEQDMRGCMACAVTCRSPRRPSISAGSPSSGVPPFAGFWSKDEILIHVWQKSHVLWSGGRAPPLLTAHLRPARFIPVFYGEARWTTAEGHRQTSRTKHRGRWRYRWLCWPPRRSSAAPSAFPSRRRSRDFLHLVIRAAELRSSP